MPKFSVEVVLTSTYEVYATDEHDAERQAIEELRLDACDILTTEVKEITHEHNRDPRQDPSGR